MKKLKHFISVVTFQIGVNIIGLPIYHKHELKLIDKSIGSCYHK